MAKKMYLQDEKALGVRIIAFITEIAVVAAIGLFIANFLFFSTDNPSKSMEPTIPSGAIVFSNRTAYTFFGPSRMDVITFKRDAERSDVLIRRVIGLPGETVRIYRGVVYINGEELDVSEYLSEITSDGLAEQDFKLGSDEYFVIGDMPANSEDSRMSTVGAVHRSQILGRTWLAATAITELRIIR